MNSPFAEADYRSVIRDGLPRTSGQPKKVLIIGAGMAGLVAAYELLQAGHEPLLLEAQGRAGGRIYTIREPFAAGLWAEAGAMRFPSSHQLTMDFVNRFGLSVSPFAPGNDKAYYYMHGQRYRVGEIDSNPELLGFDLAPHERGKTADQLWEEAIAPFTARVRQEGSAAWDAIAHEVDHYSIERFLREQGWSEGALEMFALVENQESVLHTSFFELMRDHVRGQYSETVQIDGGMDKLSLAFREALKTRVRFGAKMTAIDQSDDSVTVHYRNEAGQFEVTGDYAIVTVPFPVLRHIEIIKPFSREKQRAIRQLSYDAACKIFFQCRDRFWETEDGIYGGRSVSDGPSRWTFYPQHGEESGRGVLLASLSWGKDAEIWAALSPDDRIEQALVNVERLHPQVRESFEIGVSYVWQDDPYAGGAFALFTPHQHTMLYESIVQPEGRIHFAGEHASMYHGWVQGAIESGLRSACEIHQLAATS